MGGWATRRIYGGGISAFVGAAWAVAVALSVSLLGASAGSARAAGAGAGALILTALYRSITSTRRGVGWAEEHLIVDASFAFWFALPLLGRAAASPTSWSGSAARLDYSASDSLTAIISITITWALAHIVIICAARRLHGHGPSVPATAAASFAGPVPLSLLAILTVVSFGLYIAMSGGPSAAIGHAISARAGVKPWSSSGNYGTTLTPVHLAAQAGLVVAANISLLGVLNPNFVGSSKLNRAVVRSWCMAGFIVTFLWLVVETGTRTVLLQAVVPAVIVLMIGRSHIRMLSGARLIGVSALGLALIGLAAAQRSYRRTLSLENFAFRIDDSDFFEHTAFAASLRASGKAHFEFPMMDLVIGFVPRAVWPSKPEQLNIVDYSNAYWGVDVTEIGGNVLPSIVGQHLLAMGAVGLVVAAGSVAAGAILAGRWLRKSTDIDRLMGASIAVFVFISMRAIGSRFMFPIYLLAAISFLFSRTGAKRRPGIHGGRR